MKDLSQGNEAKVITLFTIPMLIGNFFQQFYLIIDSIIVGHFLGKTALGAMGASYPIIFMLISLIIGFSIGATVIISQYFGAKDYDNVNKTINTMFIVISIASIIISFVGIIFSKYIFTFTNLPEDILPKAKIYINFYLSGLIFIFLFNGIAAILRGIGDSKTPLYFIIFSTILNVILDIIFIYIMKMDIEGIAIANIISNATITITGIIYLNKKK